MRRHCEHIHTTTALWYDTRTERHETVHASLFQPIQTTKCFSLQKFGSIRGDDVPFILGFPLLGTSQFLAKNFSDDDIQLCKQIIRYISNFARKG